MERIGKMNQLTKTPQSSEPGARGQGSWLINSGELCAKAPCIRDNRQERNNLQKSESTVMYICTYIPDCSSTQEELRFTRLGPRVMTCQKRVNV